MTQGISNSLNLALARISYIENSFATLNKVAGVDSDVQSIESDFKKLLEEKIEKPTENKEITPQAPVSEEIKADKKDAVDLKSKIDLKAQRADIDEIISAVSEKYNIDSDFIKAIIKQESGFNTRATSKKGAMGLMQLMPKTAESLGILDAYNPSDNIEVE